MCNYHNSDKADFGKTINKYIKDDNEKTITDVAQLIRKMMAAFKKQFFGEKGLLQVTWIHSGGEANKKKANATAFPWRSCTYHTYIML